MVDFKMVKDDCNSSLEVCTYGDFSFVSNNRVLASLAEFLKNECSDMDFRQICNRVSEWCKDEGYSRDDLSVVYSMVASRVTTFTTHLNISPSKYVNGTRCELIYTGNCDLTFNTSLLGYLLIPNSVSLVAAPDTWQSIETIKDCLNRGIKELFSVGVKSGVHLEGAPVGFCNSVVVPVKTDEFLDNLIDKLSSQFYYTFERAGFNKSDVEYRQLKMYFNQLNMWF